MLYWVWPPSFKTVIKGLLELLVCLFWLVQSIKHMLRLFESYVLLFAKLYHWVYLDLIFRCVVAIKRRILRKNNILIIDRRSFSFLKWNLNTLNHIKSRFIWKICLALIFSHFERIKWISILNIQMRMSAFSKFIISWIKLDNYITFILCFGGR